MVIKKYYQVVCDCCNVTIDDFHGYPNNDTLKEDDIIVLNGKHFCNKKCEKEYFATEESE